MYPLKRKSLLFVGLYSLGAALSGLAAVSMAEENYVTAGTAYSLENNEVVYRELYTAINEASEVKVDYAKPDGSIFASKTLVYQGEYFQPSFVLEDKRDNEVVAAQFQGARLLLSHAIGNDRREQLVMDNARVVIDSGFDAYIQLNWDSLVTKQKRLRYTFAMPSRLNTTKMEVHKMNAQESPLYNDQYGAGWVYFRIVPAQKLAALFAPPTFLAYDPNGKYLMRYQGRANIDDNRGAPWDVRIEYEYLN